MCTFRAYLLTIYITIDVITSYSVAIWFVHLLFSGLAVNYDCEFLAMYGAMSDASTDTDDGGVHIELLGRFVYRPCKWIQLTRKLLMKDFVSARDQWYVLCRVLGRLHSFKLGNVIRLFALKPTDVAGIRGHKDIHIFIKSRIGPFLYHTRESDTYYTFVDADDL